MLPKPLGLKKKLFGYFSVNEIYFVLKNLKVTQLCLNASFIVSTLESEKKSEVGLLVIIEK